MQEQRARKILQSLIQGVDPTTGEDLSGETILQRADVLRALLAGVSAIEQVSARAQRRAQLPDNVGSTWSADEERNLVSAFQAGDTLADIATKHGRTLRAIEARLERLGLVARRGRRSGLLESGAGRLRRMGRRLRNRIRIWSATE